MSESGTKEGWRHLSPLSPLLRGGVVLLAVLGYVVSQLISTVVGVVDTGWGSGPSGGADPEQQGVLLALRYPALAAGLLVSVLVGVVAVGWLSWRFTRFRVTPGQVELRKGWLFRQHRQVRVDRIQSVEVRRPLLAQLLGLAQVVVQSAGGNDAHLVLAFIPLAEAHSLRAHLQTLAARTDEHLPHGAPAAVEAGGVRPGERLVLTVPNSRLLAATLLHSGLIVPLVLVGLSVGLSAGFGTWLTRSGSLVLIGLSVPAALPVFLALGAARLRELLRYGNYSLSDVAGAVRMTHGLTDHRTTTIPLHRVQAMELVQPLWWRPMTWWRVRLNVAGSQGHGDHLVEDTAVLPVGVLADALEVLTLLDPRLDAGALTIAALGDGPEGGWTPVPQRARLLAPLSWRRTGFCVTPDCLLLRTGRWWRRVTVVPHARIQSITLRAGLLQRSLGLAEVRLLSTPGPVAPRVELLDAGVAQRLVVEQTLRSRIARRSVPDLAFDRDSGVDWSDNDEKEQA